MFSTLILKPPDPKRPLRVIACPKGCGRKIIWRTTQAGRHVPLDFDSFTKEIAPGYEEVDARFLHFNTCPHADRWGRLQA